MLQRWHDAKARLDEVTKECNPIIEACKTAVEEAMARSGEKTITTMSFSVDKRMQSRESCSKKDLPAEIWEQYAKSSDFSVLTLKPLGAGTKGKAGGIKKDAIGVKKGGPLE